MSKIEAQDRLLDTEYCSQLTMGQFTNLLIKAGYTEEAAQQAASQRGWQRLCAGVTM